MLKRHHAKSASWFGSHSKGTAHSTSDIDLAVWVTDEWTIADFDKTMDALESLPTLKKWDVVYMDRPASFGLRGVVDRDGIVLF